MTQTRKAVGGVDVESASTDMYLQYLKEESLRRKKGDEILFQKIDSNHTELKSEITELKEDSQATRKSVRGAKGLLTAVILIGSTVGPEIASWFSSLIHR